MIKNGLNSRWLGGGVVLKDGNVLPDIRTAEGRDTAKREMLAGRAVPRADVPDAVQDGLAAHRERALGRRRRRHLALVRELQQHAGSVLVQRQVRRGFRPFGPQTDHQPADGRPHKCRDLGRLRFVAAENAGQFAVRAHVVRAVFV